MFYSRLTGKMPSRNKRPKKSSIILFHSIPLQFKFYAKLANHRAFCLHCCGNTVQYRIMISRKQKLPPNKSFFIFGPRQTGKSTLLENCFKKNVWSVNLLFNDLFLKYSKSPELFRLEAIEKIKTEKIKTIIIDEVQRVPDLLNEVHHLIERFKVQFALSGSSARKLKRGNANLLAGRAVQRYLFPYIYEEIPDSFNLEEVLRFGTLPAVHGESVEDKIDILRTYTDTYLREEIMMEGIVRNIGAFSRFLEMAASQFGELVSFSSIGRECHISPRTVQSHYEILEDTLIGFRLQPWMKSQRKRMVAHPKFYFFDLGVTNSLNHNLTAPPDRKLRGRLFEQFIILETYRLLKYTRSEARAYFWRTNHGAEVDLILEKHNKIIGAFEIKSTEVVSGADLTGLRSFSEEYPKTPLHVIANVANPYNIRNVSVLPWKDYLARLESFL